MTLPGRTADVVVVGAGFSGLAAARAIAGAGRSVLVLEARDRVGGRVCSTELAGVAVELGAEWTGPGQGPLKALAHATGIACFERQRGGRDLFIASGEDPRPVEPLELFSADELVAAADRLDEMALDVPNAAPWAASRAAEWDGQTVASYLAAQVSPGVASLLDRVVEGFLSVPAEVSLLHALFYSRANGGFASFLGLRGRSHDSERFEGGGQQIAIRVAAELGDQVSLRSAVRRLRQDANGVRVECDAASVAARRAIVAMPPFLAGRLLYDPPLPPQRDLLTQRFPIRSRSKLQLGYEAPFWRDDGLSGTLNSGSLFAFDTSSPDGRRGILTVFGSVAEARRLHTLPEAERRRFYLERLACYFGPRAASPLGYLERYWAADEWSRGCVSVAPPGMWTAFGAALRDPIGRIHWAGSETATEFPGQMDGAVRAGERAAREVLALL